jgi:hypothetical protein
MIPSDLQKWIVRMQIIDLNAVSLGPNLGAASNDLSESPKGINSYSSLLRKHNIYSL